MRKVLYVRLKKYWEVLDLSFSVGDVILGVDSGFFGFRHQALGPNRESLLFFLKKLAKIRFCRALDWLSSVCGLEDMA